MAAPFKEGYLEKQSKWLHRWDQRFFRLEGSSLVYYIRDGDAAPKGMYELDRECSCRIRLESKHDTSLLLSLPHLGARKQEIMLKATSGPDCEAWCRAVNAAIAALRKGKKDGGRRAVKSMRIVARKSPGLTMLASFIKNFIHEGDGMGEPIFSAMESSISYCNECDGDTFAVLLASVRGNPDAPPLERVMPVCSIFLLAAGLKSALRATAEPLVPIAALDECIEAYATAGAGGFRACAAALKPILQHVPSYKLLEQVCHMLNAALSGESAAILAHTFGPAIMRADDALIESGPAGIEALLAYQRSINVIARLLIEHASLVFRADSKKGSSMDLVAARKQQARPSAARQRRSGAPSLPGRRPAPAVRSVAEDEEDDSSSMTSDVSASSEDATTSEESSAGDTSESDAEESDDVAPLGDGGGGGDGELLPGWEACVEEDSGDTYYWNVDTDAVTWDKPIAKKAKARRAPPRVPSRGAPPPLPGKRAAEAEQSARAKAEAGQAKAEHAQAERAGEKRAEAKRAEATRAAEANAKAKAVADAKVAQAKKTAAKKARKAQQAPAVATRRAAPPVVPTMFTRGVKQAPASRRAAAAALSEDTSSSGASSSDEAEIAPAPAARRKVSKAAPPKLRKPTLEPAPAQAVQRKASRAGGSKRKGSRKVSRSAYASAPAVGRVGGRKGSSVVSNMPKASRPSAVEVLASVRTAAGGGPGDRTAAEKVRLKEERRMAKMMRGYAPSATKKKKKKKKDARPQSMRAKQLEEEIMRQREREAAAAEAARKTRIAHKEKIQQEEAVRQRTESESRARAEAEEEAQERRAEAAAKEERRKAADLKKKRQSAKRRAELERQEAAAEARAAAEAAKRKAERDARRQREVEAAERAAADRRAAAQVEARRGAQAEAARIRKQREREEEIASQLAQEKAREKSAKKAEKERRSAEKAVKAAAEKERRRSAAAHAEQEAADAAEHGAVARARAAASTVSTSPRRRSSVAVQKAAAAAAARRKRNSSKIGDAPNPGTPPLGGGGRASGESKSGSSGVGSMKDIWAARMAEMEAKNKANVFSEDYAGPNVKVGMAGYGKAPEGSESAVRAKKGKQWVKKQVKQLCQIIADLGSAHPKNGRTRVQFGPLFIAYQDISDTLVGMLQRAKKWGLIKYKGEMLWQGRDNDVWIVLTEKWVEKYGS